MNVTTRCQIITDKMIDHVALTPDETQHLSSCAHCRGFRLRLDRLRERKTLLAAPPQNLVHRIQEQVEHVPPPAASFPAQTGQWSAIASWLFFRPAWGVLALFFVVASLAWLQWRERPTPAVSAAGYQLFLPGQTAIPQAFGKPCPLPDGNGTAIYPDGSRLVFSHAPAPIIATGSCRIAAGTVEAEIVPGGAGFRVETPHGSVVVTGTVFRVTVRPERTEVQVSRGSVRIQPLGSPAKLLVAGESADMLPSLGKPASASEAGFISPSADTDVDVPIR